MRNTTRFIARKWQTLAALGALGVLPLAGCGSQPDQNAPDVAPPMPAANIAPGTAADNAAMENAAGGVAVPKTPTQAVAILKPTKGNKVSGTVTFVREADGNGVRIKAEIKGLSPGKHGFHLHEKGDCSAPDASSAGGHFNPANVAHGAPTATPHHGGDFGNITADKDGNAKLDMVSRDLSFEGDNSVIGHAVIVHSKADDLKSQPSGDAGDRVSCGVVDAK
jgi:Cu-Zn family superoxide dismutase